MQSPAGPPRHHSFQAKGKPRARVLLMESRRAEALQRQQSGRQSKVQTVRDILESAWTHAEDAAAAPAAITAAESTFAVAAAASSASAAAAASTATPSGYRAESAYHRSLRAHWAHQLMMPEPMEHLPSVAASRWMLLSRPEGLRCLVVSRRGRTLSRKKNGSVLHPKFASSLPHGGAVAVTSSAGQPVAVAGASAGEDAAPSTILDCVWNESSGSYVILDALVWNNHHLADTEAEFRLFWIWQKMSEMGATVTSVPAATQSGEATLRYLTLPASPPLVPYAFHLLEPLSCALLPALYPQDPRLARFGARQDGFLFLHRATHYEFGLSQLSLQWKDRACSPYLIEDAGGNGGGAAAAAVPQAAGKQMITLRFCPGRALHTEDEETVGTLDELVYQTSSLRQGDLLLFSIDGIDESPEPLHAASSGAASPSAFASAGDMADEAKSAEAEDGASEESSSAVSLLNLTFVKKASAARMQADSLSKILFQFHARHGKLLSIQQIAQQLQLQQQQMQAQSQTPPQQSATQQPPQSFAPAAAISSFAASSSPSPAQPAQPALTAFSAAPKSDAEGDTHMG